MLSIPTTIATNASAASSSREMGSVTPLCLEEHHDGTGAAVEAARLHERALVLVALGRHGGARRSIGLYAIGGLDGRDIAHRLAEALVLFLHPRLSRYLSASSAAMQPVPALVTAWR